jgi:hypothetical protein
MPDGDYFYWKLRGPGSRTFAEIAQSGASQDTVCDQAARMFVQHARKRNFGTFLPPIAELIHRALVGGRSGSQAFENLQMALRRCAVSHGSEEAFIAAKAGEGVYSALESRDLGCSITNVQEELLGAFAANLVDQHAIAPRRDLLMQRTGRDPREQLDWEAQLFKDLGIRVAPLRDSLFDGSNRPIRTPRKRTKQRKMTLEELHAPLQIHASQ